MSKARVWAEKVTIPTYEIGEAEKNPIFLDKRVYQGSSGKVYPYPTIEKISDEKTDKEYTAVWLENEYLKVMVLPELGGRIQRAYDKTNDYDFVYYNHVIKPALVGLTGPWISGGIEFNWPQHHRPTTFLPVDYELEEHADGSVSVLCHDVDQMYGTKGIAKLTLYPGKAYIEITGQLYNRTSLPQTFLWWANPAVPVNENTQSVFPPDVHAVMDHGKRDVSRFPIATGVYYKKDYSEGVDISRYKNIPVPTSYMAEKSKYDFVGGYDYGKEAGILHVADHHISPGKKQWTWGCGDFGKAWDRNLTDEDGPYVELMTGVYTDNQPDFTWLKPFEEKTFQQYFMPYKAVGQVKNATKEAAIGLSYDGKCAEITVYASGVYEDAKVVLTVKGETVLSENAAISPVDIYRATVAVPGVKEEELCLAVYAKKACGNGTAVGSAKAEAAGDAAVGDVKAAADGTAVGGAKTAEGNGWRLLVSYQPEAPEIPKLPEPAKAAKKPEEIMTNEELYLTGQHIEQYRHATYLPDPYYLEGLKRDPGDIRINNAYGQLLLRRGQFAKAESYFRKALERMTERNPNPYNSEAYYLLGLTLFYQGKEEDAYDAFYKATWSNEQQEMSFYYLAAIDARTGRRERALYHVEKGLVKNAHNIKARGLKAYLLRKLGRVEEAKKQLVDNLELDAFDFVSGWEQTLSADSCGQSARAADDGASGRAPDGSRESLRTALNAKMRGFKENYLMTARDYAEFGAYEEALTVLGQCPEEYPMLYYYRAYYLSKLEAGAPGTGAQCRAADAQKSGAPGLAAGASAAASEAVRELLWTAENCSPDYCFPNKLEDIFVLRFAIDNGYIAKAAYYLGNLYYDKLQWEEAIALWEASAKAEPDFATVHRNLALACYNKKQDSARAKEEMETAFALDTSDVRVFLELDQLYKKLGYSFEQRLENYEAHRELLAGRDDLYIEYITLVNLSGDHERAYEMIMGHRFHPWEGGEGKITTQYTLALLEMAKEKLAEAESAGAESANGESGNAANVKAAYENAEELLRRALIFPENLGEGKLEGTKDNHIYYYLGLALKGQGKDSDAAACFEKATEGTDEPAGALFYNDQPADMILYQGLAHLQLGRTKEAKARFWRLIDYGERHLEDEGEIGYFAVSLPDFLIFDEDYTKKNRAHCYYLMALGNIGLGNEKKAADFLEKAVEIEPSHMMCRIYG